MRDIVYFQIKGPVGEHPENEVAGKVIKALEKQGIEVTPIKKWYDSIRFGFTYKNKPFILEVTPYFEAQPFELSIMVIEQGLSKIIPWLSTQYKVNLLQLIDSILYIDNYFSEIRWFRVDDLKRKKLDDFVSHPD